MALQAAAFVDGHSYAAEDVRRLVYAATDGTTGVVKTGDWAVTATTTPSTSVNIAPGVGYVVSTFAPAQGYILSNDQTISVPIPANNTGAAVTYRVAVVVEDAQYAGMPVPSDPATALYCRVDVSTTTWTDRPSLLLATITVPANTATITNAMVTNRGVVARPRTWRRPFITFPGGDLNMPKESAGKTYSRWPVSDFTVDVPPWATLLNLVIHVNGLEYIGTDRGVAGVRGYFADQVETQNGIVISQGAGRQSVVVASNFTIPSNLRGVRATCGLQALQTQGAGNFQIDYQSQIVYDVDFRDQ